MRKLSQKAWNNVLIFSMIVMIMVLNWENFMQDDPREGQFFFNEQDTILSIKFDLLTFERVGTSWRVQGPENMIPPDTSAESIDRMVGDWHRIQLEPNTSKAVIDSLSAPHHVVTIAIAGSPEKRIFYLSKDDQNLYAMINNTTYQVIFPEPDSLIPLSEEFL